MSMLRGLWSRLTGGRTAEPAADPIEYKGYRIRPTPYPSRGAYQTSGTIEKQVGGELKEHSFVRAETHPSRDQAIEFSIAKAQQIIDEQGERMFRSG